MIDPNVGAEKPLLKIENVDNVTVDALVDTVRQYADQRMRFITATCLDKGETTEVYYHFDQKMALHHVRIEVPKGSEVPSISGVYLCAFMVENEMKELFGLNVTGLAVDYQGRLLLSDNSPKLPMLKTCPIPEAN